MKAILTAGALVFLLDQVTKLLALAALSASHPVPVIPGFFHLILVLNPGVAFGMFAGLPPDWRWLVGLLSLGALGLLAVLAFRIVPRGEPLAAVALGLIFGGALGNLLDRARLGAVVDFIDLHWRGHHWPAFNVADSAITIGVGLLALRLFGGRRPQEPRG